AAGSLNQQKSRTSSTSKPPGIALSSSLPSDEGTPSRTSTSTTTSSTTTTNTNTSTSAYAKVADLFSLSALCLYDTPTTELSSVVESVLGALIHFSAYNSSNQFLHQLHGLLSRLLSRMYSASHHSKLSTAWIHLVQIRNTPEEMSFLNHFVCMPNVN